MKVIPSPPHPHNPHKTRRVRRPFCLKKQYPALQPDAQAFQQVAEVLPGDERQETGDASGNFKVSIHPL